MKFICYLQKQPLNRIFLILLLFFSSFTSAQVSEKEIIDHFNAFITAPREVVYVHMNKSTFIKSEMLGFSAYVLDKAKKIPSINTTNLYVTISDQKNQLIKSKLIKVENGFVNNAFELDSLFSSGQYTLRAYTNWMRNFKERNYFEQSFQVIDPDVEKEIKRAIADNQYIVDLLPEGGHLVADTQNQLGILVKDQKGFGLPNAKGQVVDQNNNVLYEFQLNPFGIGRVKVTPNTTDQYRVVVQTNAGTVSSQFPKIDKNGFNISVQKLRKGRIALVFRTNNETLNRLKGKKYSLAIHNGAALATTSFSFEEKTQVVKILGPSVLFSGVNIFTVFDPDQNQPILERLYFNPLGISHAQINEQSFLKPDKDSVTIGLKLNTNIALEELQNISVSILPSDTKSYNLNSSILSQNYLEPYVRGFVENAAYYFSATSPKVLNDLDNLLITQGWSSYDWRTIFQKPSLSYDFEKGITAKVNSNSKKERLFLTYPMKNTNTQVFALAKGENSFTHETIFPTEKEIYQVTSFRKRKARKPSLSVQFSPAAIPSFQSNLYSILLKDSFLEDANDELSTFLLNSTNASLNEVQVLDEVVIESNKEAIRVEKIKNSKPFSKVNFINDDSPEQTIEEFLRRRGYQFQRNNFADKREQNRRAGSSLTLGGNQSLNPNQGSNQPSGQGAVETSQNINQDQVRLVRMGAASPYQQDPIAFLDGILVNDYEFLMDFPMQIVDYIEINKSGVGYDLRGVGGVINVVTNPRRRFLERSKKDKSNQFGVYSFPLSFSDQKKYYTPRYQNYNSSFYKAFGSIEWFPAVKADRNGFIRLKVPKKYQGSVDLHIEGIVNNSIFVSGTKTVQF